MERARWGLGDALGGFLVGFVAANLAGLAWALTTHRSPIVDGVPSFSFVLVSQLGLWLGLLGAPLLASRRKGTGSLEADFGMAARRSDAPLGVGVGLASQLVVVPLVYLPLRSLVNGRDLSQPAKKIARAAHGPAFVLLAVLLVVAAPFIEELFFRGLLLRALARRFGTRWAVAGSSLAFAVAHFEGIQFPALLVVGVVFGVLAVRYGRLGPGMWAHGAFNAVVVVALAARR